MNPLVPFRRPCTQRRFPYAGLVPAALAGLLLAVGSSAVTAQPAGSGTASAAAPAAAELVEVGGAIPDAKAVAEGLFPEEACEQLKAAGFKCMGFRPAVRYSLPATSFRLGSADLPDSLKQQLEVFAEVLRGKKGSGKVVRIEGHADASGSADANLALSQRRAEEVKRFLVERGADPAMLQPVGQGAAAPKNARDPFAPENRRVEIGRAQAPGG